MKSKTKEKLNTKNSNNSTAGRGQKDTKTDTDRYSPYNHSNNSKKVKDIKNQQKISNYKYGDTFPKLSGKYVKEWWKQKRKGRTLVLIIMQLRNNKYTMFTVSTTDKYFVYKNGMYYIDPDMVREDTVTKLNTLYYHQDCSIPFKIDFNIDNLNEALQYNDDNVQKAINPNNLREFIMGDVIQQVMKGQAMSDELRLMKILIIMVLIINGGVALLLLHTMGII